VWGACDEDLYRWTMREADDAFAQGKPFHHFVMTTSNHRPYGFPAGKIDLPPGHRDGAVKYTDFAIGKFLEDARSRPWFTNTLFVIVADHCASAAGKTSLPLNGYRIPALIWNPLLLPPQTVGHLCSQIDLPPTLLGLLGWDYETRFFGRDALQMKPDDERAYIATYQKLGYLHAGKLAVMEPVNRSHLFEIRSAAQIQSRSPYDQRDFAAAMAGYQTASHLFAQGLNHESAPH
jgi:phosphoglycerol transferase MdoB-like AlkP superfamily enzyme